MRKIYIIILILFIYCFSSYTQQWEWTIISNNVGNNPSYGAGSYKITTDKDGNIYLGGTISADSVEICDTIISSNPSICDLLVIKFSPSGKILWVKHTGGNDNANWVRGISVDDIGNCYITGWINSTCYFDTILVNANGINVTAYIAKINREGVFEWVKVSGRTSPWFYSLGYDIAISKQNEIYATGYFSDEMSLQGITLSSYGENDIFVAKFDINGNLKWLKNAGSIKNDFSKSLILDSSGNCFITGQIDNTAKFGQFILSTNEASLDGFVAKLDTSGNFIWAKTFGSNQWDYGNSIAYSPFGHIYVTGLINGTAIFDSVIVPYNGGGDIFIAKYDLEGILSFAKGFGGNNNENANSIFVNYLGNVLIAGGFEITSIFDTTHLYSLGLTDLFAAEFDPNGNLDWIIQYGTTLKDNGYGISTDRVQNVFVTGSINGSSTNGSNSSIFLGKIKDPVTPVELTSFTALYSNFGVQLSWSTSTELNNHGFEIERSLNKTNWATIGFRQGKGTTSEPQNYTYSDDISAISSSKLYYRLKQLDFNGSFEYCVIVEVEIAPTKFSLEQNYPNPFNPSTKISWQSPVSSWQTLKVYDILGNEVATLVDEYRNAGSYEIDFSSVETLQATSLPSGVYFYQLRAGDFVETKKMILLK